MSYRTPENRIRVKITKKSPMLVDLTIQGLSWQCVIGFQPASLLVETTVICTVTATWCHTVVAAGSVIIQFDTTCLQWYKAMQM